jgi:dihydroorotate dehydrogenase
VSGLFSALLRPALFSLDAEQAHGFGIKALKTGLMPAPSIKPDSRLAVRAAGLVFPNPLGMAAGFD